MKVLMYAALVMAFAIGSAAGQETCESKAVGKNANENRAHPRQLGQTASH
jgi:hypothetical protein